MKTRKTIDFVAEKMADDLPDKVYECVGEVVQLLEGAALLLMKEGNTNCFCGVELNSSRVRLGDPVNFNARLVPQVVLLLRDS